MWSCNAGASETELCGKINSFCMVFKTRKLLAFAFGMKFPNFASLHDDKHWKEYWFEPVKVSFFVCVCLYIYILLHNFLSNENTDYLKYWNEIFKCHLNYIFYLRHILIISSLNSDSSMLTVGISFVEKKRLLFCGITNAFLNFFNPWLQILFNNF